MSIIPEAWTKAKELNVVKPPTPERLQLLCHSSQAKVEWTQKLRWRLPQWWWRLWWEHSIQGTDSQSSTSLDDSNFIGVIYRRRCFAVCRLDRLLHYGGGRYESKCNNGYGGGRECSEHEYGGGHNIIGNVQTKKKMEGVNEGTRQSAPPPMGGGAEGNQSTHPWQFFATGAYYFPPNLTRLNSCVVVKLHLFLSVGRRRTDVQLLVMTSNGLNLFNRTNFLVSPIRALSACDDTSMAIQSAVLFTNGFRLSSFSCARLPTCDMAFQGMFRSLAFLQQWCRWALPICWITTIICSTWSTRVLAVYSPSPSHP
eukprot:Gb_28757 [translate_table: standard]